MGEVVLTELQTASWNDMVRAANLMLRHPYPIPYEYADEYYWYPDGPPKDSSHQIAGEDEECKHDNFLGRCPVCLTNKIKQVAECGHAYCFACAARIENCAICRTPRKSLRKIYLAGAGKEVEEPAAHIEKKRKREQDFSKNPKPRPKPEPEDDDDAW